MKMKRVIFFTACTGLSVLFLLPAGCTTTIPAREFLAKYAADIEVPNPDRSELPCRIFLGERRGYQRIKDITPFCQGGGLFGKTVIWRCPSSELPEDFPEAYRPGGLVIDGRAGAKYKYLIQSYRGKEGRRE